MKDQLLNDLLHNVVNVEFTKVNGEYRKMKCTLKSEYLPKPVNEDVSINEFKESTTEKTSCPVWDIDANGWRSFKWDNVMEFSIESA